VIVFNLKRLHNISPQLEERAKCAWLFFEWVLNNMMVPGHIESWFIIMDFDGIGLTQLPVSELKGMVGSLQRNFRGRMFRNVIVNSHWLVSGLWSTVKGWLDPFVQQKILMPSSAQTKETILQYVDPGCLEVQYGGTLPTITENFFPPRI
jgi:hypothetical protein